MKMGQGEIYDMLKNRYHAGDTSFFTTKDIKKALSLNNVIGSIEREKITKALKKLLKYNYIEQDPKHPYYYVRIKNKEI